LALSAATLQEAVVSLSAALALSGLAELFLQRIVYRVGVHIPRQGAFLEAYRFATVSGDFAFRLTAVLLAVAAGLFLIWLVQRRSYLNVLVLASLMTANFLAWPLGIDGGARAAPILFAFGAAWLVGQAFASKGRGLVSVAVATAAMALALSQYRTGISAFGGEPAFEATIQVTSEVLLLLMATLLGVAAARGPVSRLGLTCSALLTLGLLGSYAREPATVAIVSLWATGVTMSLPPVLYIVGFGLVAFAAFSWLRSPASRPLSIGLALLVVAGLQPQALHHGVTAFLGLVLLSLVAGVSEDAGPRAEVEHAI